MADKVYDPVTFDLLKVKPEDFASQITLVALPYFRKITAEVRACPLFFEKLKVDFKSSIEA